MIVKQMHHSTSGKLWKVAQGDTDSFLKLVSLQVKELMRHFGKSTF